MAASDDTPDGFAASARAPETEAEREIARRLADGGTIVIGDGEEPSEPIDARRVRGVFVRHLALTRDPALRPSQKGLLIQGAWIDGDIDLEACETDRRLGFFDCRIDGQLRLMDARTRAIALIGCHVTPDPDATDGWAVAGDRMVCDGAVIVSRGTRTIGGVAVRGARISGDLTFSGARFSAGVNGTAVALDSAQIGGGLDLDQDFHAVGQVSMAYARVSGLLDMRSARIEASNGLAVLAEGLIAERAVYAGQMRVEGETRLIGARIGAELSLAGATLSHPDGDALDLTDATIGRGLEMWSGFSAKGCVRLYSTRIGGDLSARGARLETADGPALIGVGLVVGGSVYLNGGFVAAGSVNLAIAQIAGDVELTGGRFSTPSGTAMSLRQACIDGVLSMRAPRDGDEPTLIEGALDLTDASASALSDSASAWPEPGRLYLDGFRYARFVGDDRTPRDHRARARWLMRQPPEHLGRQFRAQPFDQAMRALRAIGRPDDAKRIGVLLERRKRAAGRIPWYLRPFHRLYGLTVGYGYYTGRALVWAVLFLMVGAWAYGAAWHAGAVAPREGQLVADAAWRACGAAENPAACWRSGPAGFDYPAFSASMYSLDVFLPVIDVGQERAWTPSVDRGWRIGDTSAGALIAAVPVVGPPAADVTIGGIAFAFSFLHELAGYILSAFVIAGAATLVRADER